MALPKKKYPNFKYNVEVNPPKVGRDYMKYGMDRIKKLMLDSDENTKFLPRTITLKDLDSAILKYVNKGDMKLVLDGKDVPVIYLNNERWGEFQKTWKYVDADNNIIFPLVTIRRIRKEKGTRIGGQARVAQGRLFRYLDVPISEDGEIINLRFKMPEPVNVDLSYDVRLFSKYQIDINKYDEQVLRNFASIQEYVFIKGNPMPVLLDGLDENNTVENIDGDRYFVTSYTLKLLGFIQDEKEFIITRTSRQPRFGFDV
jgi:hypothetical protein